MGAWDLEGKRQKTGENHDRLYSVLTEGLNLMKRLLQAENLESIEGILLIADTTRKTKKTSTDTKVNSPF